MRARLVLGLAAAAFALSLPAPGQAAERCVGNGPAGACVDYRCTDDACIQRQWHVYTYCQHPVPSKYCAVVTLVDVTAPGDPR